MFSEDGGVSWQKFNSTAGLGAGKITVTADGSTILWAPIDSALQYSTDNGNTWYHSKGAISNVVLIDVYGIEDVWRWFEPLYADRANSSVIYCAHLGVFYRSDDGGLSFNNVSKVAYAQSLDLFGVRASSKAGDVWYCSQSANALQHSSDYGNTWTTIPNVTDVYQIAFGKSRNTSDINTLYIVAKVSGGPFGVYRSEDEGQSWFAYDINYLPVPLILTIGADANVFGRVYIGAGGRGILYSTQDFAQPIKEKPNIKII